MPEHKTIFDAAGITRVTATAYEDLLTRLLVVDQLPAVLQPSQAAGADPKRYVIDAALIAAALRLDARAVISDGDVLSRMLDTFVLAQLRPETVIAESEPRLYHLRTEIKASAAPRDTDARHLRWLRKSWATGWSPA